MGFGKLSYQMYRLIDRDATVITCSFNIVTTGFEVAQQSTPEQALALKKAKIRLAMEQILEQLKETKR